jgi:hypothetical protein
MASSVYATVRPSLVLPSQVRLLYTYAPDRFTRASAPVELNATQLLTRIADPAFPTDVLAGAYNLQLPGSIFNTPGIYTLLLYPKSTQVEIRDCGVLSGASSVKGLVLDGTGLAGIIPDALVAGGLRGYRIEYFDAAGARLSDYFTIVTWSNRAQAISQNLGSTTQRAVTYQFNDSGNLLFLTLTPSGSPAAQPNQLPFIGQSGGQILLTPPSFDAEMIEVVVGTHDFDTLALGLYGDQALNNDTGVLTTFRRLQDGSRKPFNQTKLFEVEDATYNPRYVVKEQLDQPDLNENWNTITQNLEEI